MIEKKYFKYIKVNEFFKDTLNIIKILDIITQIYYA